VDKDSSLEKDSQDKNQSKSRDDGRGPSTSPHASPPKGRFGPTIDLWPRGFKKTFFYMFKCHKL